MYYLYMNRHVFTYFLIKSGFKCKFCRDVLQFISAMCFTAHGFYMESGEDTLTYR